MFHLKYGMSTHVFFWLKSTANDYKSSILCDTSLYMKAVQVTHTT